MTQLAVKTANPQTNIIANEGIKNDDTENKFSPDVQEKFKIETGLEKMEELGGPKPPKPESTMHKVGRFLTGILGGLLLAAGVAAAVAATVASCGLAAGVVAGVAATVVGAVGVTGASVIAGAAGATGIGLIAGSHAMKPKNPEALLQTQQPAEKSVPLTKMGGDEVETIAEALKTNHGIDVEVFNDANKYLVQNSMNASMTYLLRSIDTNGGYNYGTVSSRGAREDVIQFVSSALTLFGIDTGKTQASPKNALMVRYAIDNYLLNQASTMPDEQLELLNNGEVKKDLIEMINDELKQMPAQTENYHMLAIFRDALNLESVDIPKPQQNPVIQGGIDENLITNEPKIKTVSMQQKGQSLPTSVKWGRKEDSKLLQAIKSLDPNLEPERTTEDNNNFELLLENLETEDDGTVTDMDTSLLSKYVNGILEHNGIKNIELNAKNILLVRHNINSFLLEKGGDYQNVVKALDSVKGRQKYVDYLQGRLNKEKDAKTCAAIRVFIAAISETDLSKLDASPLPPQDIKA